MRPLLVAPEIPTTSPRRTAKLTSSKSSPAMLRTSSATGASVAGVRADGVGEAQIHLLARHRFDQAILRQVGDGRGDDVPRVAQHRHGLADFVDLLQMVRDEQERHALALQLAHADEQALDLVAVELRGRLVENDEAGAVR